MKPQNKFKKYIKKKIKKCQCIWRISFLSQHLVRNLGSTFAKMLKNSETFAKLFEFCIISEYYLQNYLKIYNLKRQQKSYFN